MAWLDDRVIDHPKFIELSDQAFRVWAHGLIYCSRHSTGGALDAYLRAHKVPKRPSNELIKAGIWDREDDGSTWVHDWQEHNEKRDATAQERREQARLRQQRHRARVRGVTLDVTPDVTRDVTQDERDSHGVTERDSHSRAHAHTRGGAPEHHVTSHQEPQHHRDTPTTDDAAQELDPARLERAGWTRTQLTKVVEQHDLPRAIAWLEHAERNPRTRNPGGLAWAGYTSNDWPPDTKAEHVAGAQGIPPKGPHYDHVCAWCDLAYPSETELARHVEDEHDGQPRPPLPNAALEVLDKLKRTTVEGMNGDTHVVSDEPVVDIETAADA